MEEFKRLWKHRRHIVAIYVFRRLLLDSRFVALKTALQYAGRVPIGGKL